jgi:hypothetical protein
VRGTQAEVPRVHHSGFVRIQGKELRLMPEKIGYLRYSERRAEWLLVWLTFCLAVSTAPESVINSKQT